MIKNGCRRAAASLLAFALILGAGARSAGAQSPADKSAAESLFDDALRKIEAHDYLAASKALESSQRLDPGIGTLLYLGDCYQKLGRTASAWATFREAASTAKAAGQTEREAVAAKRASALEATLPKLAINVAPENDRPGFELRRGSEVVPRAVWGASVPVDPGDYTIEATAMNKKRFRASVTLQPGGAPVTLAIPELEAEPLTAPATAPSLVAPVRAAAAPPSSSNQRIVGIALGGAGLVGIGLGTFFGLRAGSLNTEANADCRPEDPTKCNAAGAGLGADATRAATASTVSFALGGAALAAGIVVVLTAPSPTHATAALRVHAAPGVVVGGPGLLFGGRW